MRQVPHLNDLHEKYGSRGLHIIGLYSQLQPVSEVSTFVADKKILYPQALNYDIDAYAAPRLPRVWIIGADGKIKFNGAKDYDKVLEEELAKVKRPGLGRNEIHKDLEPAAKLYLGGKLAEALKLAQEVADKPDIADKVLADADYLIDRIKGRLSLLLSRADAAELQGDYPAALKALEELASAFKGVEGAEEAPARLARMKADKQVAKEIECALAFTELDRKLANDDAEPKVWVEELKKFAEKHKGTKAAERALDAATTIAADITENPPEEKKTGETPPEKKTDEKPTK